MNTMMNRFFAKFALVAVLAAVALFAVGCFGGNDDAQAEQPDVDATIVAAAVRTILEATAEAKANEVPTDTPAPTATPEPPPTPTPVPTVPPTPEQVAAPPGSGVGDGEALKPLPVDDLGALMGELSDSERACLAGSSGLTPDRMQQLTTSPEMATPEERDAFLGCLGHDAELRLLLTQVLITTGPLSVESSECLRDSYAGVDLEELLGGMAPDPGNDVAAQQAMARGMVMFIVSLSCLNEEEFALAGQAMGFMPGEYEGFQCVLEAAGGQEELVVWLSPGAEFPAALFEAALNCGLQMGGGPPPG